MKESSSISRLTIVAIAASLLMMSPLELRARTYVVHGGHADASDVNPGTRARPFKTINRAAQLARPGDTVLVHAGIYRERVAPAQGGSERRPIVYTAVPGELVVIKGSDVWQPSWTKTKNPKPVYAAELPASLFARARFNPFQTPLKAAPRGQRLTLGQLFVDEQPLREVDNLKALTATPATFWVNASGTAVTVHFPPGEKPPGKRLVEVTTRDRIFAPVRRGLGYIHVKGFTMEHCANQFPERFWVSDSPQAGALGCRAGHHWLIEGNTVRFAKSIGIDCGYEGRHDLEGNQPAPQNTGHHLIRSNHITHNGCCGIAGMRSIGTRIIGNVIERNNWNRHTAPEIAGIKVHYFVGGRIEGNLIHDNDAHGIWLDNVYRNARVVRNLVIGNRGDGIFVELGDGPVMIDNNVVANTRPGFHEQDPRGDGVYSHDASGVSIVHNLVFGSHRFGSFHVKATQRKKAGVSRIKLLNNIFLHNKDGQVNLPYPGPHARDNQADHNLFGPRGDFIINPWGGTSTNVLIGLVERKIGFRPRLWNRAAPRLNLNQWRRVNSWGLQSVETQSAEVEMSRDFVLTLAVGNAWQQLNAVPVDGIDIDFFGEPIPKQGARVGPFQRLTSGKNDLSLWPRP